MTNDELQASFTANLAELEAKIEASDNQHKQQMLAFAHVAHRALSRIEVLAHETGEVVVMSPVDKPPV